MKKDTLQIEILPDGTIKTITDAVSAPNHDNAENFLRTINRLCGGIFTRERRKDIAHTHSHTHSHEEMHELGIKHEH